MDLLSQLTYPPNRFLDRIKIKSPAAARRALQLMVVNEAWQKRIMQLRTVSPVSASSQVNMLSCSTPGIYTKHTDTRFPCWQYWVCPSCLYRRTLMFYEYLMSVPHTKCTVHSVRIALSAPVDRMIDRKLVATLDKFVRELYIHRKYDYGINCLYGTMLAQPDCQWITKDRPFSIWRASANMVMIMPEGQPPGNMNHGIRLPPDPELERHFQVKVDVTSVDHGPAHASSILTALGTAYRYPAQLLYEQLEPIDFAHVHQAFTSGYRTLCRMRTYGNRRKRKREKKNANSIKEGIDASYNEQHIRSGSSYEAANLEYQI